MTTRVIINADDFGLSPGVNRGIVAAFREGVLTSTTMMVNMPAFDEAVGLAKENPGLPIGVHLSLVWGAPVAGRETVPTLVDREGRFPASLAQLALRYASGRLSGKEMRTEFRAQIGRFTSAGLAPTHLDTHKHIHCLPRIMDAVIAVAAELGIDKVRLPVEERFPPTSAPTESWSSWAKVRIVRAGCRGARRKLAAAGIRTTDHFAGLGVTGRLDADALDHILATLRPGVTEIMCHPGEAEAPGPQAGAALNRTKELDALQDPRVKKRLAASNAELVSFADI